MKQLVVDIETDELPATKVWLIGTMDVQTEEIHVFQLPHDREEIQKCFNQYDEIIGHNFIDFDATVLTQLLGISFANISITDTLTLSKLFNPQLKEGHSLRAWGDRLGFPKDEYTNHNEPVTSDKIAYCVQDLRVTNKLYNFLTAKLASFPGESVPLEHKVQKIITKQIQKGWLLDQRKCWDLLATLKEKKMELEDEVHGRFTPLPVFVKQIEPKYKKDGTLSIVGLKFLSNPLRTVCGPLSHIDFPEFNLGSRQQIGRYLQYFGWKPKDFTDTGQAIVDEAVLRHVQGIPEATLIADFLLVQKRIAQVESWLEKVDPKDGRVHGSVNTIGAVTGRMTHSGPNVAQTPSSYSPYGSECRSCWIAKEGYKLVGADASGLELRMLAHYMNDKEYTHEVINGDVHTANQKAAGLATRDNAKTFIYAFLYGAGDAKIGSIVGGSSKDGARLKAVFLDNTPSLRTLRERVERATVRGHLRGLDGRKLIIRSPHAALNTLLQSAGAIIMKKALTILDEFATIHNIEYAFVGNIHDEFQVEVRDDQAEYFGELAVECIKAAGLKFNLRCPLDGEYKIGDTWAQTH
jgi:DNA polymerase I